MATSCNNYALPTTQLIVTNPTLGVKSIEGASDGLNSAYHMIELIKKSELEGVQGYVIACFDDTGLAAAREIAKGPVIGIGEASMHIASLLGAKFSIITTLQRSVAIIESNAKVYGFLGACCQGVHALNLPVLDLDNNQKGYTKMLAKAQQVVKNDHAECLVLGCGGMTEWGVKLSNDLGIPVVDGVTSGLKLVESLLALGLSTSKKITYAFPIEK